MFPLHACVQEITRVCASPHVCIRINARWDYVLFPYRRLFQRSFITNKNVQNVSWNYLSIYWMNWETDIPSFLLEPRSDWFVLMFTRTVWLSVYLTLDSCKSTCWDTRYGHSNGITCFSVCVCVLCVRVCCACVCVCVRARVCFHRHC